MERAECVKRARWWARAAVIGEANAMCGLFGQLSPVEVAPDDWFLSALDDAGIEHGHGAMLAGYASWITDEDVEWKDHMVEYYDDVLRADKQRLPDAGEKDELLEQFNRHWVRDHALVGWEGAISSAAKALADYLLAQEGRGPCDWARVSPKDGPTLEYGAFGRRDGTLPLDGVDFCVVTDGETDPFTVEVTAMNPAGRLWSEDSRRLYLHVATFPHIALRPRSKR